MSNLIVRYFLNNFTKLCPLSDNKYDNVHNLIPTRINCIEYRKLECNLDLLLKDSECNTDDYKACNSIEEKDNLNRSTYITKIISIKIPEILDSKKYNLFSIDFRHLGIKWNIIGSILLGITKKELEEEDGSCASFLINGSLHNNIEIISSLNRLVLKIDSSLKGIENSYLNLLLIYKN